MMRSLRWLAVPAAAILLLSAVAVWWLRSDQSASANQPVYAALGASDALGVGADIPSRDGWVPRVQAGLPRGTALLNLGINGATIEDVWTQEVPVALDAQPRWLTIWPGVNDLRDGVDLKSFATTLDRVLAEISQIPEAEVVILNIPDLRFIPAFSDYDPAALDTTIDQWNAVIAGAAARYGARLVDLHTEAPELASNPQYISSDGFHPSSLGYQRIAELALDVLNDRPS